MFEGIFIDVLAATTATKTIGKPVKKDTHPCVVQCEATNNASPFLPIAQRPSTFFISKIRVEPYINLEKIDVRSAQKGFSEIDGSAKRFINTISDFLESITIIPSNVFPISEGGISIEINQDGVYYNVEIANGGETSFYKEVQGQTPEGWEYSYSDLITRLRLEFNG